MSGPDKVLATAKHWVGDGGTTYDPALAGSGYPIDQGITRRRQPGTSSAAARRPVRARDRGGRRLDHAVVLGGLDRRVRTGGPDAREQRPEHRSAQGRAGLRRLPDQRLGGHRQAARRHVRRQGGPIGERRSRHGDGAVQLRRVHHARSPASVGSGDGHAGPDRRRGPADPDRRSSSSGCSSRRSRTAQAATIGSAEHRAVARQAAAESQVLLKNPTACCRCRGRQGLRRRAPTPTTSGNQMGGWTDHLAGRLRADTRPGRPSSRASQRWHRRARSPTRRTPRRRSATHRSASSWSARRRTPRGRATSATTAESLSLRRGGPGRDRHRLRRAADCAVLVVSGRPQLVTDQLGAIDALVASWLPGTEGAGVADVLFGTQPFTGRLPGHLAGRGGPGAGQRRRRHLRAAVPVRLGPAHGRAARPADRARRHPARRRRAGRRAGRARRPRLGRDGARPGAHGSRRSGCSPPRPTS